MTEEPKCPIELKPMEEWVQEGNPEECRPCLLVPVAQWYYNELKDQDKKEMAENLGKIAEETDANNMESVLTLCKEFDRIKETVEDPLRERLKDFDCACQSFDPAAAA